MQIINENTACKVSSQYETALFELKDSVSDIEKDFSSLEEKLYPFTEISNYDSKGSGLPPRIEKPSAVMEIEEITERIKNLYMNIKSLRNRLVI